MMETEVLGVKPPFNCKQNEKQEKKHEKNS